MDIELIELIIIGLILMDGFLCNSFIVNSKPSLQFGEELLFAKS